MRLIYSVNSFYSSFSFILILFKSGAWTNAKFGPLLLLVSMRIHSKILVPNDTMHFRDESQYVCTSIQLNMYTYVKKRTVQLLLHEEML
jgi:hypothetical protein